MATHYLKIITGVLSILLLATFNVSAQFYDSDKEVRIYIKNESLNDSDHHGPYIKVFNFNGAKAVEIPIGGHAHGVLEDENFLEKKIYDDNNKIITFDEKGSDYDRTRYRHAYTYNRGYVPGGSLWGTWETSYENYDFSPDGRNLVWSGQKYTKITKDKYIELVLRWQNKVSRKWR